MSLLFKTKNPTPQASRKGGKRGSRNAKQVAYYSDPLPLLSQPPQFNLFWPSTYLSLFLPRPSPPAYVGIWCSDTRSVNVTGDVEGAEIWRRGMWGKGTLSRSEPTWRMRKTNEMSGIGKLSLEEITALKRKERAEFKEERLTKERTEREKKLSIEDKISAIDEEQLVVAVESVDQPKRKRQKRAKTTSTTDGELPIYTEDYLNKEVLQFAPEEALFLMQLGLLQVRLEKTSSTPVTLSQFLHLVATTSRSDDPFIVRYIGYYHFRRQRLVVKPGIKFGVDYLLYDGPMLFTHANFCVNVLGNYHRWPEDTNNRRLMREDLNWQEINLWQRLMGNVRKKLKLVWVEIPPLAEQDKDWRDASSRQEFEAILTTYKLREVTNSRWIISRQRDLKPDKTK
jgi:tRNA-splicing endonuclease subunit Sen2